MKRQQGWLMLILGSLAWQVSLAKISIQTNAFQYSQVYTDHESRLQYLNARYYHPATERFITRDSYHLLNRYAYADGNPVMNIDPSGHNAATWAKNLTFFGLMTGLSMSTAPMLAATENYFGSSTLPKLLNFTKEMGFSIAINEVISQGQSTGFDLHNANQLASGAGALVWIMMGEISARANPVMDAYTQVANKNEIDDLVERVQEQRQLKQSMLADCAQGVLSNAITLLILRLQDERVNGAEIAVSLIMGLPVGLLWNKGSYFATRNIEDTMMRAVASGAVHMGLGFALNMLDNAVTRAATGDRQEGSQNALTSFENSALYGMYFGLQEGLRSTNMADYMAASGAVAAWNFENLFSY